jgi:hypothetical protein
MTFYGRCRGGPYNTLNMVHGEPRLNVALDKFNGRPVVGVQTDPAGETFKFGTYRWNYEAKQWEWDDPETAKSVDK